MQIGELLKHIDELYTGDGGGNGYSDSMKCMWINEVNERIITYRPLADDEERMICEPVSEKDAEAVTLCEAPYDRMYIDFILAKMAYYNKNFESYAQHISLFNSLFAEYMAWCRRNTKNKRVIEGWL